MGKLYPSNFCRRKITHCCSEKLSFSKFLLTSNKAIATDFLSRKKIDYYVIYNYFPNNLNFIVSSKIFVNIAHKLDE